MILLTAWRTKAEPQPFGHSERRTERRSCLQRAVSATDIVCSRAEDIECQCCMV